LAWEGKTVVWHLEDGAYLLKPEGVYKCKDVWDLGDELDNPETWYVLPLFFWDNVHQKLIKKNL
jgi:hypothetical protein